MPSTSTAYDQLLARTRAATGTELITLRRETTEACYVDLTITTHQLRDLNDAWYRRLEQLVPPPGEQAAAVWEVADWGYESPPAGRHLFHDHDTALAYAADLGDYTEPQLVPVLAEAPRKLRIHLLHLDLMCDGTVHTHTDNGPEPDHTMEEVWSDHLGTWTDPRHDVCVFAMSGRYLASVTVRAVDEAEGRAVLAERIRQLWREAIADRPCAHRSRRLTRPMFSRPLWLPCHECETEAHAAWVGQVAGKLRRGLAAAAEGRFEWSEPPGVGRYVDAGMSDELSSPGSYAEIFAVHEDQLIDPKCRFTIAKTPIPPEGVPVALDIRDGQVTGVSIISEDRVLNPFARMYPIERFRPRPADGGDDG